MNKLLIFTLLLSAFMANAQQQKLSFEYDDAGNQTQRSLCTNCPMRISNQIIKEIADLKPEDLEKFFPEDEISYYPNPVKEQLYLKWELINENKVSEIQLYSLNGQLVKRISALENTNNQIINFQNLPTGIFSVILLYTNGEEKAIKIIKQ